MTLALDFVSPLPPVRSGIAEYSVDLLPELDARCDLRVVRLDGQPVAESVIDRFAPVASDELGAGDRLPLYQMGNNPYHAEVRRLALAHSGVMTLHDLWLHHALMERTLAGGDLDGYVAALVADHGWLGGAAALPPRWSGYGDAVLFALPVHRSLVASQRGILVHSEWARGVLEEELGDVRVRAIPMPMPVGTKASHGAVVAMRSGLGVPDGAPLLGSFGFQTPIKRTASVLRALARPGLEEVFLLVAGEVSKSLQFERLARELGIEERVKVSGFLDDDEFRTAIEACDLCVNLRYPTAGETSASLLRIFAHGRGAVVSDYAQFAELPDDVAVKVPVGSEGGSESESEIEALARTLSDLVADPERMRAIGEAALSLIREQHRPALAADAIVEACREWQSAQPPDSGGDASRLVPVDPPRPSTLTWGWLPSRLEVEGLDTPWPHGERRRLRIHLTNTGFARWLAGEREEGGVVVEVRLFDEENGDADLLAGRPWLALPRDLDPGEAHTFDLELRRPLGGARLCIEPHVLGAAGFGRLGGAVFEARV